MVAEQPAAPPFLGEFTGTALDYLQSVYKSPHADERTRVYAATVAARFEPHLADDALIDAFFANATVISQLEVNSAERCRGHDAKLHEWIAEGRMSEETALLVRGLLTHKTDPPWEPMPPPASGTPEEPRQIAYISPNDADVLRQDPPNTDRKPHPEQNGADAALPLPQPPSPLGVPPQPTPTLILFSEPFANYQAGSGRHYCADELGEIRCEGEDDAKDLIRSGCRPSR
jgi:hypothetical protein